MIGRFLLRLTVTLGFCLLFLIGFIPALIRLVWEQSGKKSAD